MATFKFSFRYGKIPASAKALNAEYYKVKGLLLYEEPTTRSGGENSIYERGIRRSSLLPSKFGDIMSPGWPSRKRNDATVEYQNEVDRASSIGIKVNGKIIGQYYASYLPKVPVQPLPQEAAKDILENLEEPEGWKFPDSWKNEQGNLVSTYKVRNVNLSQY